MLFKRNNRSFKFCLLDLSDLEHAEISRLITENGGEVCTSRDPPAIAFARDHRRHYDEPVFHINYVRECVKRGEILDLMKFKFGDQGIYGCLMSVFIRGENQCQCIRDISSRCMATQTEPNRNEEPCSAITEEDNYAQGDCDIIEETNTGFNVRPILPDLRPADETLRDTQSFPGECLSSINSTMPQSEECLRRRSRDDSVIGIPEAVRFEEIDFELNTCSDQSQNTMVNSPKKPSKILSEENIHIVTLRGEMRDTELGRTQTSTESDIMLVHSVSATKEYIQVCDDEVVCIEQENEISSNAKLRQAQNSELEIINVCKISTQFNPKNVEKRVDRRRRYDEYQPVAGGSKDVVRLTIPRVETGIEVFDREVSQSPRGIEESRLDSPDDEDIDMNLAVAVKDCGRGESVNRSSPEQQKTGSKKKASTKNTKIPGPYETGQPSTVRRNPRPETNVVECNTASSDEAATIMDIDGHSSSENDATNSSSCRAARPKTLSKRSSNNDKQTRNVSAGVKRLGSANRKFSAAEQCAMLEYLINNGHILDAKGNRVWLQMIMEDIKCLNHRTYQSLQNHFRRQILPNIHQFSMDPKSMRQFKKLQRSSTS